ncbi:hypothetical protein QYF36_021741 [Acer negundo]|nr:hypothetical protein QYF36_021741 [Acer negundo]
MEPGPNIDIIKFVGCPICKYWTYHRKLKEYLNSLVSKKDELQSRKEDVELRLSFELQLGKKPRKEVENWLKKAGKAISESQDIEDRVSKVNCLSCASVRREIDGKIQEMIEVHNQGSFPNSLVIGAPSNSVMTLPTPGLVGETTVKEKIWAHLMGDSVSKIGVCGMRGIGKTSIMKHIHDDLLKETKFDKVIWITVSKEFDVIKLQEGIANALNEDLSKLHKDRNTWAAILFKILEARKRYILILDDVWQRFSLEDVGIPEPTRGNGCKLVLTTRSTEEARSMGCEIIKVEHLQEKEALDLFLNNVGRDLLLIPTLHSTLKQVVEQCAGLPLVIVTVANSLMGEYDIHTWNNALNELKGHKEELIEYWIVEELIDEMETRQATYSVGHAIFNRLENNGLLKSCRGGTHVKMHDLVRDMALFITSTRYLVQAGKQLKELPEQEWNGDAEKVSLMQNNIKEVSFDAVLPKCSTVSTLLLQRNQLERIHESFFKLMKGIQILDLSYNVGIKDLPDSISDLENITALLLHGCTCLEHVPSLAKLQALKKLDLGGTSIKEVPRGTEMLVHLSYLDLNAKSLEQEIPDGMLRRLSRLQYLRLDKACTKAKEVLELKKLETVGVRFNNLQDYNMYLSHQLQRGWLDNYFLSVGCQNISDYSLFSKVNISDFKHGKCVAFEEISGDSILLPADIQELNISNCIDLKSLNDRVLFLEEATDLRRCTICKCQQIECIVSSSSCYTILESIEELWLLQLDHFSVFFRGGDGAVSSIPTPTPPGIFSCLKHIQIHACQKIKKLFWPELVHNLQNLEVVDVKFCLQLVEIIAASDDKAENEGGKDSIVFTLPKLREIRLWWLPELKCICNRRSTMVCNSLQTIEIKICPELKRIPLSLTQLDNGQLLPPISLEKFTVDGRETWDSLEWDHPDSKNVLEPYMELAPPLSITFDCFSIQSVFVVRRLEPPFFCGGEALASAVSSSRETTKPRRRSSPPSDGDSSIIDIALNKMLLLRTYFFSL